VQAKLVSTEEHTAVKVAEQGRRKSAASGGDAAAQAAAAYAAAQAAATAAAAATASGKGKDDMVAAAKAAAEEASAVEKHVEFAADAAVIDSPQPCAPSHTHTGSRGLARGEH
jgi:hypothetical protein